MSLITTITSKGQVTIPRELRRKLGLEPHQKMRFYEENGRLVADRVTDFRSLRGKYAPKGKTRDVEKARRLARQKVAQEIAEEGKPSK